MIEQVFFVGQHFFSYLAFRDRYSLDQTTQIQFNKWHYLIVQEIDETVSLSIDQGYRLQIASPFTTPNEKIDKVQFFLGDNGLDGELLGFVDDFKVWRDASLRQQNWSASSKVKYKGLIPSYIYQGIPFMVDFTNLNQLVSYSGHRNIKKSGLSQYTAIQNIWKVESPLQDLNFCQSSQQQPEFYDSVSKSCKSCPYKCTLCQSLTQCQRCEFPYLISDSELCELKKFISPTSGNVQSTNFQLSQSYDQLVQKFDGISYSEVHITYPDMQTITTNTTTFIIPNLFWQQKIYEVNITVVLRKSGEVFQLPSQTILVIQQEVNQEQIDQIIDQIKVQDGEKSSALIKLIEQAVDEQQSSDDQCECIHGTCTNQLCTCDEGYEGMMCQYTNNQFQKIRDLKLEIIKGLQSNQSITNEEKLETIHNLSGSYQTVNHQAANITMSQLQNLSIQIKSKISNTTLEKYITSANSALQSLTSESDQKILNQTEIAFNYERYKNISTITLTSSEGQKFQNKLGKLVHTYYYSFQNSANSPKFGNNTITLPPSVEIPPDTSLFLFQIFLDIYDTQANKTKVGPILDISIFNQKQEIKIQDSQIQLEIELDNQTIAMANSKDKQLQFLYWNGTQWSNYGTQIVEIGQNYVKVKTSHLSKFSLFLKQSYNVLEGSNYNLFSYLQVLTLQKLLKNPGSYIAIAYWAVYLTLNLIIHLVEKRKYKGSLLQKLKREMIESQKSNTQKNLNSLEGKATICQPESSRRFSFHNQQTFQKLTQLRKPKNSRIIDRLNTMKNKQSGLKQNSVQSIKMNQAHFIKSQQSRWKKIAKRLEQNLSKRKNKNCCKKFTGSVLGEISQNNLPFNIVTKPSVMQSRKMRLSLFFLGILSDIAANALFFDLDDQGDQDEGTFFDNFNQNFWTAIYSALITIIFLFLLSVMISFPQSYKRKIQAQITIKSQESQKIIEKLFQKFRISRIFAYIFFFLASSFLQIYVIAFCEAASQNTTNQWLSSSFLTFLIDMVLFELIASILVTSIVMIKESNRYCKWIIIFALLIEVYRAYKNLSD